MLSKAQQLPPGLRGVFFATLRRMRHPWPCEYGHVDCSIGEGGACSNELAALSKRARRDATMRTMAKTLLATMFMFATAAAPAAAQTIKYLDDQGVAHYVGSVEQVPSQYRARAAVPSLPSAVVMPDHSAAIRAVAEATYRTAPAPAAPLAAPTPPSNAARWRTHAEAVDQSRQACEQQFAGAAFNRPRSGAARLAEQLVAACRDAADWQLRQGPAVRGQ